jgi:acyl-CoA thioester hydrolase
MSESRPLLVELPFVVKTYDVDYLSIAHNIVYIRWLEDLRLKLMADHLPLQELLSLNQSPVLERTEIVYRWPLRLFNKPVGRMWLSKLTRARWEVQAEIVLDDLVVATAAQSGYIVDLQALKPVRIPAVLRQAWEAAVSASDDQAQASG